MSTDTQNNTPESAGPVVEITGMDEHGPLLGWHKHSANFRIGTKFYAAPVAAQPDLTQQTLDDVMAGIPARDAEIAALQAQQDADKVDAALAEMVHAMFRSANCIPVTRITIDRKQYDAAIDAARKEQA